MSRRTYVPRRFKSPIQNGSDQCFAIGTALDPANTCRASPSGQAKHCQSLPPMRSDFNNTARTQNTQWQSRKQEKRWSKTKDTVGPGGGDCPSRLPYSLSSNTSRSRCEVLCCSCPAPEGVQPLAHRRPYRLRYWRRKKRTPTAGLACSSVSALLS